MLFWGITLLTLALDAGSKMLSASFLQEKTISIAWLLELRLTKNTGMALGIFSGSRLAGIILPVTAIFCGWLMMRRYRTTRFTTIACALVMGGFIGNFAERLLHGYVLDMIFFPWMPWFVCNAADIFICFGVALLAFSLLFRSDDWQEKEETNNAKD